MGNLNFSAYKQLKFQHEKEMKKFFKMGTSKLNSDKYKKDEEKIFIPFLHRIFFYDFL